MQVTGASAADQAASATDTDTATGKKPGLDLGYDAFIQLLLAQLKHQDPLKPMESTEYVSQLATLSNLEQVVKQSEKLDQMLQTSAYQQASALIGMAISVKDQNVQGTVVSAEILSDGVWVTLDNGSEVRVGEGVAISKP